MTDLISGTALLHFAALVEDLGGDPDRLLLRQGIEPAAAGDGNKLLPYPNVAAAIGNAAADVGRTDFCLLLAERQGIDVLGPIAVLIRNAETVSDAIKGACRYLYHCAPPEIATLKRGPATAVYSFQIALRQVAHREQIVEKSLGMTLVALRLIIGADFVPHRVTMQHHPISSLHRYREFFGCPVEFRSRANGIHFPDAFLDRSIRGRDAAALALAENYLAQSEPNLPLVDHVREAIHRLMKNNHAALVSVADAMAMHPRVLQRRLNEARTSFEAILDDVRRTMSWQLSSSGLQAAQIATKLGYSEQSSYSRACRRWYGVSPRQLITQRRSVRLANDAGLHADVCGIRQLSL
jgi:AraC-like DNA-binding protein